MLSRRDVVKGIGAGAMVAAAGSSAAAGQTVLTSGERVLPDGYRRADASWMGACHFGVSTHWTAMSKTVGVDDWLPFAETVARFDADKYAQVIADAGAQYVIFTTAHALQMLPAPCEAIEQILPGRTQKRDLIGDLADACGKRRMKFIMYYNHSINSGDDAEWEYAVGYHERDKRKLVTNLCSIVSEMGARYGSRAAAWWFDSSYSLDDSGPYVSVTTEMNGFRFPWEEYVAAAKTGFAGRLVTLNPGVAFHYLYSTHQDYEAGEANQIIAVPTTQFTREGLQGHRWVCLDNAGWVHSKVKTPLAAPRYSQRLVTDYVRNCNYAKVPVTFNIDIDRTGVISPESLKLLKGVRSDLG